MASSNNTPVYSFTGVLPQCVENRLVNSSIDKSKHILIVTEFNTRTDGTSRRVSHSVHLPREITDQRIIGQPLCIGCKGDFYVFQFISVSVKHIQFFSVAFGTETVQIYQDNVRYFNKDIMTISPTECHISANKELIFLRLPQAVLRLHKQSNIFMIHDKQLRKSKLLDKKFNCVVCHPFYAQILLIAQVNDICVKCSLTLYDIEKEEILVKKDHNINTFSFDFDNIVRSCRDDEEADDSSDEENTAMSLCQTSLVYDKTSDLILLTCFPSIQTFISVCGFDAITLHSKFSFRIQIDNKPKSSVDMYSTELSLCNTKLCVYLLQRHPKYRKQLLCSVKLPVVLNLKYQVRSFILQYFTGEKYQFILDLLPNSLKTFMNMSID